MAKGNSADALNSSMSLDVTDFKTGIAQANRDLRELDSGFKASVASLGDWSKSSEGLEKRMDMLSKSVDVQKQKISQTQSEYEKVAAAKGKNSVAAQELQIKLNKENETLGKLTRELGETESALDGMGKGSETAAKGAKKTGDESDKAKPKVKSFKEVLKDLGDKAAEGLKKVPDQLASIGKAAGVALGGLVVGTGAAVYKLATSVIKSFGELEQNLGGSEAVFQQFSDRMNRIGEDAYRTMGASQSQYLATANIMGSLFQGSGIEIERSADLTSRAMQRAADMASVMGIDVQTAFDSIKGAAKGNFTMMDNLGVAMNATTLEAYALEKGLDFVWAQASNAEKAELAMEMFFEKTEQYAGNFEREATQTVTGSFGLMKAAADSFVAGLGSAEADMTNLTQNMVDAFGSVVQNLTPVLQNIFSALPQVVGTVLPMIGALLPDLLNVIMRLFSQVFSTIVSLLPTVLQAGISGLGQVFSMLLGEMPKLMEIGTTLISTLIAAVGEMGPMLMAAAPGLIMQLVNGMIAMLPMMMETGAELIFSLIEAIGELLPELIPAAIQIIVTLISGISKALPRLMSMITTIIPKVVITLVQNLPLLIQAGLQLIITLVNGLVQALPELIRYIPEIVMQILIAFLEALPMILGAGAELIATLIAGIVGMFPDAINAGSNVIANVKEGIVSWYSDFATKGRELIDKLIAGIKDKWTSMTTSGKDTIQQLVNGITSWFGSIGQKGKELIDKLKGGIMGAISSFTDVGRQIVEGIWGGISAAWSGLVAKVKGLLGSLFGDAGGNNIVGNGIVLPSIPDGSEGDDLTPQGNPSPRKSSFGLLGGLLLPEVQSFGFMAGIEVANQSAKAGLGGLVRMVQNNIPTYVSQAVPVGAGAGRTVTININPSEPIDYELLANKVAKKITEGF